MASKISPIGVRMPPDMREQLRSRAFENRRSMNAEIIFVLQHGLDAEVAGNTYTATQVAEIIDALEARRGRPVETLAALKGLLAAYGDDAVFDEDSDRHVEAANRLSDAALQAFKVIAKAEAEAA